MRLFILLVIIAALTACNERVDNPGKNLSLDYFSQLKDDNLVVNSHRIRKFIGTFVHNDNDSALADYRTRNYYKNSPNLLWITRNGLHSTADTLLRYISEAKTFGFFDRGFRVNDIRSDIGRVRTLSFDSVNTINKVYARLEYNLTKALMRYAIGQRFGYVNPEYLLNKLDVRDSDSVRTTYRRLYDVSIERPTKSYYARVLNMAGNDSLPYFLRSIQPKSRLFNTYLTELQKPDISSEYRRKVLVNMERARWRSASTPEQHEKYIIVNIPSQHLYMYNGTDVQSMKIGCGSQETKTPILNSQIKRIDVNPQWVVPYSIIKKDISRHAGDEAYFTSRRYIIKEKSTGKTVTPAAVTTDMLLSNKYSVIQQEGQGNSLGRIIFRFDNNFSVFLHDTPSRSVFSRRQRDVSHGCVRVERPLDFAAFLIGNEDEEMIDKIKYSMSVDLYPEQSASDNSKTTEPIDHSRLVRSIKVSPQVPLFITYYTLYPVQGNIVSSFPDIYGFDRVIYENLKTFIE